MLYPVAMCRTSHSRTTPDASRVAVAHLRSRARRAAAMLGITLLETLMAVAVLAVLAAIAVPMYGDYRERTRIARAVTEIADLQVRIIHFQQDNRRLPQDLDEIGAGSLLDPWGRPYRYLDYANTGKGGQPRKDKWLKPINSDFDLYSLGKDGDSMPSLLAPQSRDDVVRAWDGRYIGLGGDFDP